jgi:uncharacterized membrane protein YtjA (UPF0391 family)
MSRSGPVILFLALVAGYFGFGSIVTALGGPARALLSVFVLAFLVALASKGISWRRRGVRSATHESAKPAGAPAPA